MHPGGIQYEIDDLRREISRKANKDSLYSIDSDIARLERMINNLSSNMSELEHKISSLESENYTLREQLSYIGRDV